MAGKLHQPGKRQVLIIVFIVPRTDQFLPRRLAAKQRSSQDIGGCRAAARYKARHGSCAVLIIDNTNTIAKWDLQLLYTLQEVAKLAADLRLYKVISVNSDGVAPAAVSRDEHGFSTRHPRQPPSRRPWLWRIGRR